MERKRLLSVLAVAMLVASGVHFALAGEPPQAPQAEGSPAQAEFKICAPSMLPGESKLQAVEAQPCDPGEADRRVRVTRIKVSGNTVIATAELDRMMAQHLSKDLTLRDLNKVADDVAEYYAKQGYILTYAFLPPQGIRQGLVEIVVRERQIEKFEIKVRGEIPYSIETLRRHLDPILSAKVFNAKMLDQALTTFVQSHPGIQFWPLELDWGDDQTFRTSPKVFLRVAKISVPRNAPILRIEIGMHVDAITSIGVDTQNRYLVTGAVDKTVRVWQLPAGRLVQTLRPMIAEGTEGVIAAVAISPDGSTIAAAGDTNTKKEDVSTSFDASAFAASVYLFDRQSGRLIQQLQLQLPWSIGLTVKSLNFSHDGTYLVVGYGMLWSGAHQELVAIFQTKDWQLLPGKFEIDRNGTRYYVQAAFDYQGRLVVIKHDFEVRGQKNVYSLQLYDNNFRLLTEAKLPDGKTPTLLRLSPDGRKIGVAFVKSSQLAVLSGEDLSVLYTPDTSRFDGEVLTINWSADGRVLYAGGTYQVKGAYQIRKWDDAGRGRYADLPAARQAIVDIRPLQTGGIVYGAEDPAFGILDVVGRQALFVARAHADYRGKTEGLLVSSDGATIQVGYQNLGGTTTARFTLHSRRLELEPQPDNNLASPVTRAPEVTNKYSHWISRGKEITINGFPLPKDFEMTLLSDEVRSIALSSDHTALLVGTDSRLVQYDIETKKIKWRALTESPAWAVNIAGKGQIAVAALGDGTIRWYRLKDGKELLALFPHVDKKGWALWTPEGYFDALPGAEDWLGWHVNQGRGKEALFFPASQFSEQFYRPDLVAAVITHVETDKEVLARLGERERVTITAGIKLPPTVAIRSPQQGEQVEREEVEIEVQAEDQGGGIDEIRLYHNGKRVGGATRNLTVVGKGPAPNQQTKVFAATLVDGPNVFQAVALSRDRIEGFPDEITIVLKGVPRQATLHVLAVGINEYKNPALNLNFARPDAQGILKFFVSAPSTLFKEVKQYELRDHEATKPAILTKLQSLQATAPQDVVVIYLAGHGDSLERAWYFIPYEVVMPEREETMKQQALSSVELNELLVKIKAQKVLLLIDACKSGAALVALAARGLEDRKALAQLSRAAGVHVVAASTKEQVASEVKDLGHGVFTYTLLEGLSGKADGIPKDGVVTVRELLTYVENRLPEVSQKYKTEAQYPVADSHGMDFPLATVR